MWSPTTTDIRSCAAVAGAALLLVAALALSVAPQARAQTGPQMTVSQTEGLDPEGTPVTVTGSGYDEQKGIYVAVCVIPPEGQMPSPCLGGADMSGESASQRWISSNPPPYGEGLAQPYDPGGSFAVEIVVPARDEFTDCTVTPCAVVSRNDHTATGDRSQDVIVPVSFAEAAEEPPPIPEDPPTDDPPPSDDPPTEDPPADDPPADDPPPAEGPPIPPPLPEDPPTEDPAPPVDEPQPTPSPGDPPGDEPAPEPTPGSGGWAVTRTAGADRFATAAALSADAHPFGAPVVYVATGGAFPDALAGGPAAAVAGAPVLLVTADDVPEPTRTELGRLAPERIVVLGGPAAVGDAVLDELGAVAEATRLAGPDRFATAAAISTATWTDGAATAFVATGADYPDALTGAAAAGAADAPVLLTGRDEVPDATRAELARLAPERIVVLGGASAVSDAVVADLGTTARVSRVAGDNRFATAAQVADLLPAAQAAFVATGANYPDALAASAVAGRDGAPILLVTADDVPDETMAALDALDPAAITVLGGVEAVTDQVMAQLQAG